ncbi:MAG: PDZ domain-containing protein, partial [Planctomycetota bacterium]|nr:PDZ domain-containing protein [Planctomycetota bacterium]
GPGSLGGGGKPGGGPGSLGGGGKLGGGKPGGGPGSLGGGGKPGGGKPGGGPGSLGGGGKPGGGKPGGGPGSLGGGGKPGDGKPGKPGNRTPGQGGWVGWDKKGWDKHGWNNQWNSHHQHHHHGYWNSGIWIPPLVITNNEPWYYLQPTTQVVSGRRWLGVTYLTYEGGGAYVSGVYEGSPAQQVGLEVGDVIVSIDGNDASDLPAAIRAANDVANLQVLSGRTGELLQAPVNLLVP